MVFSVCVCSRYVLFFVIMSYVFQGGSAVLGQNEVDVVLEFMIVSCVNFFGITLSDMY